MSPCGPSPQTRPCELPLAAVAASKSSPFLVTWGTRRECPGWAATAPHDRSEAGPSLAAPSRDLHVSRPGQVTATAPPQAEHPCRGLSASTCPLPARPKALFRGT